MRTRLAAGPSTVLSRSTEAILRSRLALARADVETAMAAAEEALAETAGRAPWWRAKAIRVLERAGAANAHLVDEARSIERRLGIG
jgi:hypothetical protein